MFVQAFVSQTTIEALHKAILHGLSRGDVVPLNLAVFLPPEDGVRCQFGTPSRQIASQSPAGQRLSETTMQG